jgi:UDP-N-acetyl-D-mannosaminuronic acid dehydrogenase
VKLPYSTVAIIGLGYIGLPTAAVLASRGVRTIGVDIDRRAVEIINRGEIHIVEPDLDAVVSGVVKSGFLRAVTRPEPADAFVIAVPTPFKDGHEPDVSFVETAARTVAPCLRPGNLVVLESTSPVGTTENISRWLAEERRDLSFPLEAGEKADIQIAYCPERVLPGKILSELVDNDRVIGGITPRCAQSAASLYRIFVKGACHLTAARTAEMCKLTENAFRDVNIAFANELSLICDKLGVNVWEMIKLANRHPRVNILQPGPGVGGHCIAVDPWFIVSSAPQEAKLIRTARQVNDGKPDWVLDRVRKIAGSIGKDPVKVGCLGLAFKADIDDLRESPAMEIVATLAHEPGFRILANEPNVKDLPRDLLKLGVTGGTVREIIGQSDMIVLLVDHKEYRRLDWAGITKPVLDTRGILSS